MWVRIIIFLVINFSGLFIGSMITKEAVQAEWYQSLEKAPWTPPGIVFGIAWFIIMIGYAIYMAKLWSFEKFKPQTIVLFVLSWLLNVLWNPIFFQYHWVLIALVVISLLAMIIIYKTFKYAAPLQWYTIGIIPYCIWIIIATSLNAYIYLNN